MSRRSGLSRGTSRTTTRFGERCASFVLLLAVMTHGCRDSSDLRAPATETTVSENVEGAPASAEGPLGEPEPPAHESALPESLRALIDRPFTGDLDEMVDRRMIRVGVTFNRTHYFVDQGTQRGLAYEYLKQFEDGLNAARKTRNLRIHLVFLPMSRDKLLPALTSGRVDAVAAQLTITPERQKLVDFSIPTRRGVSEVVVTAPDTPMVNVVDDLSGREVFVRRSSSYYESLRDLNRRLESTGRMPVEVREAAENLEDDDLLEMVNAGLIPATIVDDYLATYWAQIFTDLVVNSGATLRTGGDLAVAVRKNSSQLAGEVNAFIRRYGLGSAFGNTVTRRYLQETRYALRATRGDDRKRFLDMMKLFRKYSEQYGLDYLLMTAQGYQESRLNQNARSPVGAIGVMQIMPATGKALGVGDIRQLEPNVHGGVKYVRRLMDDYLGAAPMDHLNKELFTLAAYNAGPTRILALRREAERRELNPNEWFGHVERIVSERIGRETVTYVSNIYKYYIAYRLVAEEEQRRGAHRSGLKK